MDINLRQKVCINRTLCNKWVCIKRVGTVNIILDIDECKEGSDNCHKYATCTNTIGSFTCKCNVGFEGDGVYCKGAFIKIIFCNIDGQYFVKILTNAKLKPITVMLMLFVPIQSAVFIAHAITVGKVMAYIAKKHVGMDMRVVTD